MNLHEFQGKQLFAAYQIPTPRGTVHSDLSRIQESLNQLNSAVYVVKAQIHAGGRGKAGGVKLTRNKADVSSLAQSILGKRLVTHQTGPQGREVKKVLIEEGLEIARELYLSLLIDRQAGAPVFIASAQGGMEIEELAERAPEKIIKVWVDSASGYMPYHGRSLAFRLGLEKETVSSFLALLGNLYRLFMEKDASLIEINPLVITKSKTIVALDSKMTFDDNALFRHEDIRALRDLDEEEPLEIQASNYNLNYVKLNGTIGCMVNGAGLAMATMDLIKLAGAEPANFLDVGGGATKETVSKAFQILLADPNVKGVFVNIFGGIVRCERIAGGIIEAAKEIEVKVPLVVRLEGTNAKEGREMLKGSGLKLDVAETMWQGAQKVVGMVDTR
jgi:succinyl-CoA synthetase beta subunit